MTTEENEVKWQVAKSLGVEQDDKFTEDNVHVTDQQAGNLFAPKQAVQS